MTPAAPALNVMRLIDEVISSRLGADAAVREVEKYAQSLAEQGPSIHSATWDAWYAALSNDCYEVTLRLLDDRAPTRVWDVGSIIIAASSLISPAAEAVTRLFVGRRLLELDRPDWALGHLGTEDWAINAPDLAAELRLARAEAMIAGKKPAEAAPLVTQILEASGARAGILAAAMLLRSRAHAQSGQGQAAVEDAREAVDRWKRLDDAERQHSPPGWRFYQTLGEIARAAGDLEDAIAAFESGRQVALELGHSKATLLLLSEIGFTWQRAGDDERGNQVLTDAAREADAVGEKIWASRWIQKGWPKYPRAGENLADKLARAIAVLGEVSRAAEAEALFKECIRDAAEVSTPEIVHAARNGLASAYRLQRKLLQATLAEEQAIKIAEEAKDVTATLAYRTNLAWILTARGRRDEAEAEADRAISIGEQLRHDRSSVEFRQTVGGRLTAAYEVKAYCAAFEFVPRQGAEPLPPRPERLFDIGQRIRAVNLMRWLALGEMSDRSSDVDLRETLMELRAADVRLEAGAAARDEPLAMLVAHQEQAQAQWDAAAHSCAAAPPPTVVLDAEELTRAFPERLFVDLLSLEEGMTINGFHAGGWMQADVAMCKRSHRVEVISEWHDVLIRAARSYVRGGFADDSGFRRLAMLDVELDEKIIEPLARCIERANGPAHLTIFPHRELSRLPFWRLESMLPGISVSLLPGPASAPILGRRQRSLAGPWVAFRDVTGRLRHVEGELQAAAFDARLVPTSATVFDYAEAALLHFAGHAHFDLENPYRSGILAGDAPGDAEDPLVAADPFGKGHRILTVAWIFGRLRLPRAHTVVLSACQTGLPRQHPASEFTSLPAAFLVAGTRNVIASLWPAHDATAQLLMEHFYRDVAKVGAPWQPSVALAQARRYLMSMAREEARARLPPDTHLPPGERPFAASWAVDVFQHYGVD